MNEKYRLLQDKRVDMRNNQDVNWDDFNADTYRERYFSKIGNEDWWIAQEALQFLSTVAADVPPMRYAADIGSGPSVLLPLISVPFVERIELIEPGLKNVTYLQAILSDINKLRNDWSGSLQKILKDPSSTSGHVRADELLCDRGVVRKAGIMDLESDTYDLVTSIFCAESATESKEECADLIQRILASLKKGRPYIAGYIEHSEGYPDQSFDTLRGEIDTQKFPAANIDEAWLRRQYEGTQIQIKRCPFPPGMRAGYTGVLLAIGIK
jgi:hypothetical protein